MVDPTGAMKVDPTDGYLLADLKELSAAVVWVCQSGYSMAVA